MKCAIKVNYIYVLHVYIYIPFMSTCTILRPTSIPVGCAMYGMHGLESLLSGKEQRETCRAARRERNRIWYALRSVCVCEECVCVCVMHCRAGSIHSECITLVILLVRVCQ